MFRKFCFAISGNCGYVTLLSALDFDDIGHMHTFASTYKPFHNILSEVILFALLSIALPFIHTELVKRGLKYRCCLLWSLILLFHWNLLKA